MSERPDCGAHLLQIKLWLSKMTTSLPVRFDEELCSRQEKRSQADSKLLGDLVDVASELNAGLARLFELIVELGERGIIDDLEGYVAWKCGLLLRTAREYVRVARALAGLPRIKEAFTQGRLPFVKVSALVKVAEPETEQELLEASHCLTAAQLQRAVARLIRVTGEEALQQTRD